jgi:hypothetical protein
MGRFILIVAVLSWSAEVQSWADDGRLANDNNPNSGGGVAPPQPSQTAGMDCYAAVYDQSSNGTIAHYGKGTWDSGRSLCIRATGFTDSNLGSVSAIDAAKNNSFAHAMYVIDREQNIFYAPCGAAVNDPSVPGGLLPPGTYSIDTFQRISPGTPFLGNPCNVQ